MSTFKIICSDRGAGPTFFKLLKFLEHPLRFNSITRARQQNPEVVERGFVVRLSLERLTKSGNRFDVLFLLAEYLPQIDVRTDVVRIDFQHTLKFGECFIKPILRSGDQSQNVMWLWFVRILIQRFLRFTLRALNLRQKIKRNAEVDPRD